MVGSQPKTRAVAGVDCRSYKHALLLFVIVHLLYHVDVRGTVQKSERNMESELRVVPSGGGDGD